ncbi:hypothetical protein [Tenggerimyces flavus]|uniref:Uncharacterized protein n=1 Tax=Tenggerimyces flavus TaxID=1708749 RepID=A0ABV7YDB4_9ACTN|nr:hypothetical protein [Tenggerimyces flavus]MBM7788854.1 hypothetical protein [Tenggerimyces flavus]
MVANMRYEVCGAFPVLEVAPGGVVEHAALEVAGANIDALLQAGLIKPAEQAAAKAPKGD